MRDKVKRFLSILMTALMLVNLMPVGALAEGMKLDSNSVQSIGWWPWPEETWPDGSYKIYVYAKVLKGSVGGINVNKDGWYTLGYIDAQTMPSPIGTLGNLYGGGNAQGYDLGSLNAQSLIQSSAFHFEKNTNIPVRNTPIWSTDGAHGFKACSGATDYPETGNAPTWHLDILVNLKDVTPIHRLVFKVENSSGTQIGSKAIEGTWGQEITYEKGKDVPETITTKDGKIYELKRKNDNLGKTFKFDEVTKQIEFYYKYKGSVNHTLTINYVYEDGSEAAKSYQKTLPYQSYYSVTSPDITGYTADNPVVSGTMPADNVEVTVTYTKRTDLSYTVNYLEKVTNKVLHDQKVQGGMTYEDTITSANEKIDISGYNYDSVDPETLTIQADESKNVINLYYTKQTNLSYKVNYLEQGTTNVLHEQKVQGEMTFDDVVKSEDEVIEINGYNYASADKETLTIGTGENVLNLYYTKRTDLSYTVNYYWNGTTEKVADSKTEENQTFEDVIIEAPKLIEGYTPISLERQELIITTDDNDNTITFYYYKNVKLTANSDTLPYNGEEQSVSGYTCAVEEKQKDGSVEYVPWTGEKPLIFEGVSASGRGKDVNENGYPVTFNDTPIGVNDGLYYVNESQTGTLTITPRSVTLTSETAGKTYDGTALEKPVVTVGGDGFVEGQVKEIKATGSVTNAGSVANTITFTPNKETFKEGNYAITKTEGTLTIAKRSVLITSQSATKTYDGSALTRPAVTITGDGFVPGELAKAEATGSITKVGSTPNAIRYTTTGAFNAANYSIALSVGTLTVTEKPKPEPRRTFNLTINYVYQNGKRAAASYNRGGLKNGETFDITSPVIAGYTASETVVSGTIYNRDIKVTVIYTADGVNLDDYGVPLGLGNITMNVGDCFE